MSKLLNSLYTIQVIASDNAHIKAEVHLDIAHNVFNGHFPSQKVLPGVTMIEMIKDILRQATGSQYALSKGSNIKFLKVVDPEKNSTLTFDIAIASAEQGLKVSASSQLGDGEANFKFKGTFTK